jgi:1-aminocyclopropane-1-carboxylate synthase
MHECCLISITNTWLLDSLIPRSDEIYAMSVWGEDAPHFESMESIARAEAQLMPDGEALIHDLVHVVFGLSKDFCASGLRFGCLHSRNQSLNRVT